MIQSDSGHLRQAEKTCLGLLQSVEDITEQLIEAARRSDVSALDRLIESRQLILDELSSCYSGSFPRSDEFKAMENRLLKKQEECELLVARGLEECRTELLGMRRQRQVRTLYGRPIATGLPPRFLDRKL